MKPKNIKDTISAALGGNPNSGKTTLFNALTGARQHVGNYPGITVDKKEGIAYSQEHEFNITDLPGTYSLTAYSQEELVARTHIADEQPEVVVDVVNAGSLERNLYLTVQLMEMGAPTIIALNMMDEAAKQGLTIDHALLSDLMGIPVVPTVARSGKGIQELLNTAAEFALQRRNQPRTPLAISYGPDLDPVLKEMVEKLEAEQFLTDRFPARWTALKYLENDEEIRVLGRKAGKLSKELEAMAEKVAEHCSATLKTYPEAIIADYRYGFISSIIRRGVVRREPHQERMEISDRLDQVLTHRALGPIIMLAILYGVYKITFVVGDIPMVLLTDFFDLLGDGVSAVVPPGMLRSLLVSGIIDGVGGVLSFVPLIMIIFFLIAILEDSGYMARIAYMLDRVFRIFGLHGCSVMPFIISGGIGGGCAVPGVMAARTLRSPKEKLATLLTAPFMTCGAKLPVFILMVGVFFPNHQAPAMFAITLFAWPAALITAKLLRMSLIRGESTPFVMELPPYRFPTWKGLIIHTWERTRQYIIKAGTLILAASILLWAAMTFPRLPAEAPVPEGITRAEAALNYSLAGRIGEGLESITQYAGFEKRINIALMGGIAAKEIIISTLGTAYSLGDTGDDESISLTRRLKKDPDWTAARGIALILFIMLYSPCSATLLAIRAETKSWGWTLFSLTFNTGLAFFVSVFAYQCISGCL